MPRTRRSKPLYQRGDFRLYPRDGRNHEIIWYDEQRKRERSRSAGTSDDTQAKIALDKLYLDTHGGPQICPTCQRPWQGDGQLVANAIMDYMSMHGSQAASAEAISYRLGHVSRYLESRPETRTDQVDDKWIAAFRDFMDDGNRAPATIEGSVHQLAAAFRKVKAEVLFEPIPMKELTRTPTYRADLDKLAEAFDYAMAHEARANLLSFLRLSVMTWARPDAAMEATTKRRQWDSNSRVFNLNPSGRRQTKKYRATVPIGEVGGWWLDNLDGRIVAGGLSGSTWQRMARSIGIPGGGEGGMKLIRRSVSTMARKPEHLGETYWIQGRMMLGHVQPTTSDYYAIHDPTHLGRALAATDAIIEGIESRKKGAFTSLLPHKDAKVWYIGAVKNG